MDGYTSNIIHVYYIAGFGIHFVDEQCDVSFAACVDMMYMIWLTRCTNNIAIPGGNVFVDLVADI